MYDFLEILDFNADGSVNWNTLIWDFSIDNGVYSLTCEPLKGCVFGKSDTMEGAYRSLEKSQKSFEKKLKALDKAR